MEPETLHVVVGLRLLEPETSNLGYVDPLSVRLRHLLRLCGAQADLPWHLLAARPLWKLLPASTSAWCMQAIVPGASSLPSATKTILFVGYLQLKKGFGIRTYKNAGFDRPW